MAGGSLAEEGLHIMGVMKALAFGLLAVSTLFVIVDPVASLPAFLSMTANDPVERQIRTARLACGVATGILFVFAVLGTFIFQILGITMPAFQLAASEHRMAREQREGITLHQVEAMLRELFPGQIP